MSLPRTILVPTDFSETSEAALAYALSLAKSAGAKIVLLHTYSTPVTVFPTGAVAYLPEIIGQIMKNAEEALAEAEKRVQAAGVPVERCLEQGDPRTSILETSAQKNADLICMGTHGRRGVAHMLIGSVAEYVVRASGVPVLVVRGKAA